MDMQDIRGVMLDLDGTVYLGDTVFPYTLDFLRTLDRKGIRHLFLTNNSSKGTSEYLQKFARMGIPCKPEELLISSHAAADYLKNHYPGKKVMVLGTESMQNEMRQKGIPLSDEDPEVLLAAFDTSLQYDRLTRFVNLVARGLPYVATHPDLVCPAPNGFLPDLGSMMEMIFACTKRRPEVICGKPNEQILIAAEHLTGMGRENLLMVGDRLSTDIAIGKWGVRTCLVLSGEAKKEDLSRAPVQPTYIFPSIHELGAALTPVFEG